MVDDRDGAGGEGGGGGKWRRHRDGAREVEEEYAAARKSRPIFQRGTIARLSDHLKYLVAGRKLSGTGSR